jgi:hypothetical protein
MGADAAGKITLVFVKPGKVEERVVTVGKDASPLLNDALRGDRLLLLRKGVVEIFDLASGKSRVVGKASTIPSRMNISYPMFATGWADATPPAMECVLLVDPVSEKLVDPCKTP